MPVPRTFTALAITTTACMLSVLLVADQQGATPMPQHDMGSMKGSMKTMTKAEKIANAIASAPASVSAKATVFDWPAKEGGAPEVLRAGTNGWKCFPDLPETPGNDPMCVDEPWMNWLEAYVGKKTPQVNRLGIGYMMAPGGAAGSNTDPYAMKEMPGNHWLHHDPHIMVVVPDPKALAGISTDPKNGGPYVMWAGTPYVHVMVPTSAAKK
jgi:hypothetical protein